MAICTACGGEKDCYMLGGCRGHYHCDCGVLYAVDATHNEERFMRKQKKALK